MWIVFEIFQFFSKFSEKTHFQINSDIFANENNIDIKFGTANYKASLKRISS